MRPVHPKIDGALYRPTTTAACGTATATDDSPGYYVIKFVKGRRFQNPQITQIDLKNLRNLWIELDRITNIRARR